MLPVCSGETDCVNKYNITSGERSSLPSLPGRLDDGGLACTVVNNTIIISGGCQFSPDGASTNKVWELDLQAGKWKPLPSLQKKRYS